MFHGSRGREHPRQPNDQRPEINRRHEMSGVEDRTEGTMDKAKGKAKNESFEDMEERATRGKPTRSRHRAFVP